MKKLLSFILALLMLTSVASAAFADQDQIEAKYTAAVSKMSESGIVSGFPNGNFAPKD
ncbi:MAG: S-layer homology domain-containing protein, partial [Oscillospiraceae bacterium]|nr:S-layer homology domain-containing protein [Oscillospiraceae bacterium]